MPAWIPYAVCLGVASVSVLISKKVDVNLVAMRFFRDLSRSKARKRLYGDNKHALIPMLLGKETMLDLEEKSSGSDSDGDSFTLTIQELSNYKGQEEGTPLYLSIAGRIYDVSAGSKFYGPDGKYHLFVGTDATRAFAKGCFQPECISSSTEGLNEKEMKEIQRWIELYETHDKYTFVGHLLTQDPVDAVLERAEAAAAAAAEKEEEQEEKEEEEQEEKESIPSSSSSSEKTKAEETAAAE